MNPGQKIEAKIAGLVFEILSSNNKNTIVSIQNNIDEIVNEIYNYSHPSQRLPN